MSSFFIKTVAVSLLFALASAKTIVSIDGIEISDSIFDHVKAQQPNFNYDNLSKEQKEQILEDIISTVLAANEAKKSGLDKSEEFKLGQRQLLSQLWLQKEVENNKTKLDASDDEAKKAYETHKSSFIEQEANISHILVKSEEEAKNIISDLNKTPKSKVKAKFSELASKLSIDGTKSNGGNLGDVNLNNMVVEFREAAKKLKPETYSKEPVKSQFGYHVIYLQKISPEKTKQFSEVKEQIKEKLREEKIHDYFANKMKQLRDAAKINYN